MNDQLVILYQQMYEHTKDECAHSCRVPHSCCTPFDCEMTANYADTLGITLQPTGHPKLPFMGPTGCVVPPHLRPDCTLHTCAINSLGFKPDDLGWTRKYFQIRSSIHVIEYQELQTGS